jgi:DNA modification methylase
MNASQLNTIHVGDCIGLMRQLPDACCRLVIADPPYNLGKSFGAWREWRDVSRWLPWCKTWLAECVRLLADGGSIFVHGIHHYLCYLQVALYDFGLTYRRQIIWHYENGFAGYTKALAAHYEPILWFSKGNGFTYHPIREPYKSTERLKHRIIKDGKVWQPNPAGRLAGDVWSFPTLAGRRFQDERVAHPTQKPRALTDRIIRHFSNAGDLVVVPFAGSGTECISAAAHDRPFWGAEINANYVALAHRRLGELNPRPSPRLADG